MGPDHPVRAPRPPSRDGEAVGVGPDGITSGRSGGGSVAPGAGRRGGPPSPEKTVRGPRQDSGTGPGRTIRRGRSGRLRPAPDRPTPGSRWPSGWSRRPQVRRDAPSALTAGAWPRPRGEAKHTGQRRIGGKSPVTEAARPLVNELARGPEEFGIQIPAAHTGQPPGAAG